jgi:cytosine/uracil/thiamine/allantoin permease
LFVERMRINVAALFDPKGIYHYWHGVNVTAIVWCFLGGGVYYLLPTAALPAVIVPLITGAGYLLTMRLLARLQRDSRKGQQDYELQASSPGK